MRRLAYLSAIAALAIPAAITAQPSLNLLDSEDVGGILTIPAGIAAADGNAWVVGFGNRRIAQIADVATTVRTTTTFARTDTADGSGLLPVSITGQTWAPNRGLLTADFQAPNKLLVAGDVGATSEAGGTNDGDGYSAIFNTDNGSNISEQAPNINSGNTELRVAGSAFWDSGEQLVLFTAGTNFQLVNAAQDGRAGAGFYSTGGSGFNMRDIIIAPLNGQTVYASYTTGSSIGVREWPDVDNNNRPDASGQGDLGFSDSSTAGTVCGITYYNDLNDSNDYLVLCDPADNEIIFIDLASPTTAALTYDASTDIGSDTVMDATVLTVGSSQYLLVSVNDADASAPNSRVAIYGLNGATLAANINDWMMY